MIVFELTMPHRGSWNNKWSGDGNRFIRLGYESEVPKDRWNKDYYYRWDDGWEACVSVTRCPYNEARKLERKSAGFCGYEWMIWSIVKSGRIDPDWKLPQEEPKGEPM